MPLTTVSNAWREDGREAWLSSQGKPNRGRPALGRPASRDKARTRAPKATRAFGWRGRKTTCGLRQRGPSSKPFAASAIAPGPFRGWGRKPLARIRAQREPVVPPAGTGTEYPRPRASSRLARRQGVRKPLVAEARHTDQGNGGGRDSWSNDLLAPSPDGGQTGRAHRCRRRRALWSPARCGTFASPPVKWPARQGEARIRTPWRQHAACAVRCAGPSGTRSATCPCSPGSASRTRTRRSCPCAAASVRRTAGRPAPAAA